MNQGLISAFSTSNDLEYIAKYSGLPLAEFKKKIIKLVSDSSEFVSDSSEFVSEEKIKNISISDDDYESDSSNEEDVFYNIIKRSEIKFTDEQLEFMNLAVREKCNIALLSAAGYGKSAVIEATVSMFNRILKNRSDLWIKQRYNDSPLSYYGKQLIGVCASTGKAASLIKGRTLHSYLGIGMGRGSVDDWVDRTTRLKSRTDTFHTLRVVYTIIIDEISMVSSKLLDDIDEYLRKIRLCNEPFGGVQMIFVGDYCQLPPVNPTFAFISKSYKSANIRTVMFSKCFRQTDPLFLNILNELRYGNCSTESEKILSSRDFIEPTFLNGLTPIKLLSTNSEVDTINEYQLHLISKESGNPIVNYKVRYLHDVKKCQQWMKAEMIPEIVSLTVGAQVMITHNIAGIAVNGTQGKIIDLRSDEVIIMTHEGYKANIKYITFKDPEDKDIFAAKTLFHYLPIRLGWAITIHKSQGCTLTCLEVDLKKVFAHGQCYVAISRAKTLEGLIVKNFSKKAVMCSPLVKGFYGIA